MHVKGQKQSKLDRSTTTLYDDPVTLQWIVNQELFLITDFRVKMLKLGLQLVALFSPLSTAC